MSPATISNRLTHLKTHARALWLAFRDPRTPWYARAVLALVLALIISPIDPIPDFIPVLGYLDDLLILMLGMYLAVRLIPEPVLAECRARAEREESAAQSGPLGWLGAALVIALWAALLAAVILAVRHWGRG
ncbi:MAG: YkvA family protein [Nitrospirota bacterium]|nr:YkvA family protein [Nitrospirota bacterium]